MVWYNSARSETAPSMVDRTEQGVQRKNEKCRNPVALFDKVDLSVTLILDGALDRLEAGDVLHLGPCAEFFLADGSYREVNVCSHGTFLHLAVGDP